MDEEDVKKILKAIYEVSHIVFVSPLFLIKKLNISDEKIGDWLEILAKKRYVEVKRDTFVPGISLSNGINKVRITRYGTEFLRATGDTILAEAIGEYGSDQN
jgi:hypothetical protein